MRSRTTMPSHTDTTEILHGATIQHGKKNNRIYLMDLADAEVQLLIPDLISLATENSYGKIFAKIPQSKGAGFTEAGFTLEAKVERLYGGEDDGLFLAYYLDRDRREEAVKAKYDRVLNLARSKQTSGPNSPSHSVRLCTEADAEHMANLYRSVFDSYPFPIDDPAFIVQSMQEGTIYGGIEDQGILVALASAECDFSPHALYAEMTDFATKKDHRGNGYALSLLAFLERVAHDRGIRTLYTIARAISPGMNITFAKSGYLFGGRLRNNTDIGGDIESMNVWYRPES